MPPMTKFLPPTLALTFLASLAGCNSTNPPIAGKADPYAPNQVNLASRRLASDTRVGAPRVSRDENGLLFVTVPIRSQINKTLLVDYRATFFDENGRPVGEFTGPTKTLDPNTPDTISFNSTTADAADFEVDLRYAR